MTKTNTKTKSTETGAKPGGKTKSAGLAETASKQVQGAKAAKPAPEGTAPPEPSKFGPKRTTKFLSWLTQRHQSQGGATELRAIADQPSKQVKSAYVDGTCIDEVVDVISPAADGPRAKIPYGEHARDGEANFYVTLNSVKRALLARSANKFSACQGTGDADILAVSLILIDFDPERPSGISATDEEKKAAWRVVRKVRKFLASMGVEVIVADSGNGYHLLILTVPYHDVPAASAKVRQFLKLLDAKFSTQQVKIDTGVFNAARITKLYGTKAVKGSDTADRPHRYSSIDLSDPPEDIDLFAVLAQELAEAEPGPAAPPGPSKAASKAARPAQGGGGWDFETSARVVRRLLETSGVAHKEIDKDADQGRIFAFEDCPHHTDPDGHHYECSVMVKPDGSFAANCFHDDAAGWHQFKALIGWDEHIAAVKAELGLGGSNSRDEYLETPKGYVWLKRGRDGAVVPTAISNFTARITRQTVVDDGDERRTTLHLEVRMGSRTLPVMIPSGDFAAMNWVGHQLGGAAIINPGDGVRDRVRHAIQVCSGDIPSETSYPHTGWRNIGGVWVYLHSGGAIGADGPVPNTSVALDGPLARFALPAPPEGKKLHRAILASMGLLRVAPLGVTAPLFSAVYRAVFGHADFSVYICGPTGNGKTVVASLGQQHWGAELDFQRAPGNWSSTVNANEGLAFQAKDAVLLIDDFAPGSTAQDSARLHRDADRLFRNAGNGTGRARMRSDATHRPTKYPRGLIVSTGEDVPRGQSVRARLLVGEMSPEMVDWEKVTPAQKDAAKGLYAASMAAFVQWVAGRYDEVMKAKPARVAELRELAADSEQHRRTPGIVAELYFGVEMFCDFAVESGAITEEEAADLRKELWNALGDTAAAQLMIQTHAEPAQRFLDLLAAAIASGAAHLTDKHGSAPPEPTAWGWHYVGERQQPRGMQVGWVVDGKIYLEPQASYAAAQSMVSHGNDPIQVGGRTLHKRLNEQNKLVAVDKKRDRLTVRRTLQHNLREVLYLRPSALGVKTDPAGAAS